MSRMYDRLYFFQVICSHMLGIERLMHPEITQEYILTWSWLCVGGDEVRVSLGGFQRLLPSTTRR